MKYLTFKQERCLDSIFGRMWHTLMIRPDPFSPVAPCEHDECMRSASSRVLVNIWGVVWPVNVCDEHASYHGRKLDDFPMRRTARHVG